MTWYGQLARTFRDAPGVDAFSLAARIQAPVLGLHGGADGGIPAADVRYRRDAAEDGWKRRMAFFDRHLKG